MTAEKNLHNKINDLISRFKNIIDLSQNDIKNEINKIKNEIKDLREEYKKQIDQNNKNENANKDPKEEVHNEQITKNFALILALISALGAITGPWYPRAPQTPPPIVIVVPRKLEFSPDSEINNQCSSTNLHHQLSIIFQTGSNKVEKGYDLSSIKIEIIDELYSLRDKQDYATDIKLIEFCIEHCEYLLKNWTLYSS